MRQFFASIIDNPIFIRELRRRMRGKAMIFSTNAYIIFMCLVAAGVLVLRALSSALSGASSLADVGDTLFGAIVVVQTILVMMIAPTITSGMATAERERKTFDFLRVTTLSPFTFVMGGLLSTMLYAMVVLVCALPLLCIAFLYGGIQITEVFLVFFLLTALTLLLSCAGLVISSTRDRTKNAQGITMALVILVGFYLYSQSSMARLHNLGQALATPLTFWGTFTIPTWVLFFIGTVAASWFLLVVAARKLYILENRPMAYRHSVGLFVILSALFMGWTWHAAPSDRVEMWINGSTAFFLVIAVTHCLHQLEVGSEIWTLKRTLPFLRVVDESPFFVAALLGAWGFLTYSWLTGVTGSVWGPSANLADVKQANLILSHALVGFGVFFLAVATSARFFAWRSSDRAVAFKHVLTYWGVAGVILPMIALLWASSGDGGYRPVAQAVVYLCPVLMLRAPLNFLRAPNDLSPNQVVEAITIASALLGALVIIFAIGAIWQRRRDKRPVSYELNILEHGAEY